MAGLVIAAALIAALLLVHFSLRSRPMPTARPLDVEAGLPLPEAGQASTVFSLTALFGAYFGIYLLLGLPALAGLGVGTVAGLWFIRSWIAHSAARSFEQFVLKLLSGDRQNATALTLAIVGTQCGFATSEVLILREIVDVAFGVRPDQATLLVVGLVIVSYFYVLFGGYMAVFRTDVLQFSLVAAMGVIAFVLSPVVVTSLDAQRLLPRPGYWNLPGLPRGGLLYIYQFIIASIMGFGFLVASPDAWKRVFLVSHRGSRRRSRFVLFVLIGAAPFVLLLPMAMATNPIPDGPINVASMWAGVLRSNGMFVASSLGLIASFLSSFNGAFLLSVHLGLLNRRRGTRGSSEMARFHWLMTATLLTVVFSFYALRSFDNPFLLANLLLGPYAIVAGVITGVRNGSESLPAGALPWILVGSGVAWFIYFVAQVGFPPAPTTYQVNSVPPGVLLFGIVAATSWTLGLRRRMS